MLALLMALQVTTTHCSPDYLGGVNCTTNSPNATAPAVRDYYGQFTRGLQQQQQAQAAEIERQRSNVVGTLLSKGDCAGAANYALQAGDLDLAARVRSYCGR